MFRSKAKARDSKREEIRRQRIEREHERQYQRNLAANWRD